SKTHAAIQTPESTKKITKKKTGEIQRMCTNRTQLYHVQLKDKLNHTQLTLVVAATQGTA
ncbi:MAG: hypothetical protein AB2692_18615, partial [Candidatus Thiodiazotropha sp.]